MNTLLSVWHNDVVQKAYRAAVVSLLGSLVLLLTGLLQAPELNFQDALSISALVAALTAAFRATLAVVIPAIVGLKDRMSSNDEDYDPTEG